MSRKVAGEATAAELKELDDLLSANPELQYAFNIVEELSFPSKFEEKPDADELERKQKGLNRLGSMMDEGEAPPVRKIGGDWYKWLAAASIVLFAGLSVLLYINKKPRSQDSLVETAHGKTKKEIQLPDGTTVILNAGSRLQYDGEALRKGNRVVTLYGEGFFKVKADENHPFMIKTGKVEVRVLGTVFNLKAYPEDNRVETYLISGKVEVAYNKNRTQLKPRERFVINLSATEKQPAAATQLLKPKEQEAPEDAVVEPAWMQSRLEFENVTFEQLTNELERWYNVRIDIKNDKLKGEVFSGAFNDKPLPEVLEALQYTLQFKYKISKDSGSVELW
ncbi:FecR family protein [Chitinophaga niabensis]|uniref:Ferric-dicitrate binding protein FerR, regulates iron transport through sigma-19 n=1 Tax=Chitinophaga niabensis TaxID=536979 RepID=A0A1N6D1I8_9BACT|nr:FecR domain-containing protein [Chitinophaga niabensis]SIN64566.1 ferric-dicitrate binding protein FerR, regulates iron transport through sigma-19 [Chitinophaga niabensis]